jgi:hypothetical protein
VKYLPSKRRILEKEKGARMEKKKEVKPQLRSSLLWEKKRKRG